MSGDELMARGKQIAESGKYVPPRGEYLGRIDLWGIDVYEHSPQERIDALFAEEDERRRRGGAQR